ncbi:MAG: PQQ-binding-like beta-propeller repeat protein [Candidatus Micrarchaeia archaeon]|jgi:outer membrane protein assembly factor BamB
MKKIFFIFLILFCFSFANTWELNLNSKVQTNIEIYNNSIFAGCINGDLVSIDLQKGNLNWKISHSIVPEKILIFNDLIVFYGDTSAYFYYSNGTLNKIYSFSSKIYGASVYDEEIYFTTLDGVYIFSKDISLIWDKKINCIKTKPIIDEYFVYFNCNNKIYALDKVNKNILWETDIGQVISFEKGDLRLFVSTADNKIKTLELTEGKEVWNYKAGGWITEIESDNKSVFFISNDYSVYALNADTGNLVWSTYIGDLTRLEINENIVLVGTKNNKIFGLDKNTGEEKFVLFTSNWPENLKIINDTVFYSTLDRDILSHNINHVCTFEYPNENSLIGSSEFELKGKVYSLDNSVKQVEIFLIGEDNQINSIAQGVDNWTAYIDPYFIKDGMLEVLCKVYPYENTIKRQLIKTPQVSLIEEMEIKYPSNVEVQETFQIYALNKYDRVINDIKIIYEGNEYVSINGYITMFFDTPGIKEIEISRKGYKSQTIQIQAGNLQSADDYTLFYLAGIIILIIAVIFLIKKIKK